MLKLCNISWYSLLKLGYSYRQRRGTHGHSRLNGPVGKRHTPSPLTLSRIPASTDPTATTATHSPVNLFLRVTPSFSTTRAAFAVNRCMVRMLWLTSTSRRTSFPSEFCLNNNLIMTILFEMFKAKNSFIATLNDFTILPLSVLTMLSLLSLQGLPLPVADDRGVEGSP